MTYKDDVVDDYKRVSENQMLITALTLSLCRQFPPTEQLTVCSMQHTTPRLARDCAELGRRLPDKFLHEMLRQNQK